MEIHTLSQNALQGALHIRVLDQLQQLSAVHDFWMQHADHPNASLDLFQAVHQFRREVRHPYVLVLERNATTKGLVLARFESGFRPLKLGYWKAGSIPLRTIVVLHDGILGDLEKTDAQLVAAALLSPLRHGQADLLHFAQQREDHPLTEALLNATTPWSRAFTVKRAPHWLTELPPNPGEFLLRLDGSHRRKLARYERQLSTKASGQVRTVCYQTPAQVPEAMAAIETVAKKTYQRGLGVGFEADRLHGLRFESEAKAGRFRAWVRFMADEPVAFRTGFVYGHQYHGATTGYDDAYAKYSIGLLLLAHAIDDLVREGVRFYDWGMGDAAHKQRFGTVSFSEIGFGVYANTACGMAARCATTWSNSTERVLRFVLSRSGLLDRIKHRQRRRLAMAARVKSEPPDDN